jgi:hypothetical protein
MAIDRKNLRTPAWVTPLIGIPFVLIWLGYISASMTNTQDARGMLGALDQMGAQPSVRAPVELRIRKSVETTVGLTVFGAMVGFAWCLRSFRPRWWAGLASRTSGRRAALHGTQVLEAPRALLEAEVDELRREVTALAQTRAAATLKPRGFALGFAAGCGMAIVFVAAGFVMLISLIPWGAVH